jgi:hypothetical protein
MASFPVPAFNIQVGLNTIGPALSPVAISVLTFDIDMAAAVALQPFSPAMLIEAQSSVDAGQSFQLEFRFDITAFGLKKDGTQETRLRVQETIDPPIPAGARVKLLVDSPVAFHSTGGTIATA